eukprot:650865-Hanusia_phi.AAC.1
MSQNISLRGCPLLVSLAAFLLHISFAPSSRLKPFPIVNPRRIDILRSSKFPFAVERSLTTHTHRLRGRPARQFRCKSSTTTSLMKRRAGSLLNRIFPELRYVHQSGEGRMAG